MSRTWRVVIGGVAIFNILIGLGFLIDPAGSGLRFFLAPMGTQGMASLRADFTAFFVAGGGFALYAAWQGIARPLRVPLALLGLALFGRVVSLVADGPAPTAFPPMAVEAVMIALLLLARRSARA
jgi:hypothetical protein